MVFYINFGYLWLLERRTVIGEVWDGTQQLGEAFNIERKVLVIRGTLKEA